MPIPDPPFADNITVATVELQPGELLHTFPDSHLFALSPPRPTLTPAASDGATLKDIQWDADRVGYLPPAMSLHTVILEPSAATFVTIPDRAFETAAFETIDTSMIEPRWLNNLQDPIAASLINAMTSASAMIDASDFPMLGEAIGVALAVRIAQQLGAKIRAADVPHARGLPKETLKRVLDYIESNIGKSLRLSELAGVAMLSTFHFARAFQKAMNVAPVRYVWTRRIERAKEALRNKAVPLVVVAFETGFGSQSHFSTAFKKATGMSPATFRAGLPLLFAGRGARYLYDLFVEVPVADLLS